MYCRHCGKEIADTAMFCRFCGTQVAGLAKSAPVPEKPEAPALQPVRTQAAPQPAQPASQPVQAQPAPAQTAAPTAGTVIPQQPIDPSAPPVTVEEGLYPWLKQEARVFGEPKQTTPAGHPKPATKPMDFDPMEHPYLKGVSREEAQVESPFDKKTNPPVNATGGNQSFTSMEVHHDAPAAPVAPATPAAPAAPAAPEAPAQPTPQVQPAQPAPAAPAAELEVPVPEIEPAPSLGPVEVEAVPDPFTDFVELPNMPEPPDPNAKED